MMSKDDRRSTGSGEDGRGAVAILLCTFNGARFLPLQLASYEAQDYSNWRLFVSDDGSTDDTLDILTRFQDKHGAGRVQIRRGPGRGAAANFMSLICDPAIEADGYALSDQDDVWMADKLSRARSFLVGVAADVPGLYCSRVRMIDADGAPIGLTPLFAKPPDFRNALVQNIAIGNTVVFNVKTRNLLQQAGADVNAAVHDWWIYLATTAVGGKVFYDPCPSVDYRIHARNLIGANNSRVRQALMLLNRFKAWSDLNVGALDRIAGAMLPNNKATFELYRRSRRRSLFPRLFGLWRCGLYRGAMADNIGLMVAAVTGKI